MNYEKIFLHSVNPIPILKVDLDDQEGILKEELEICKNVEIKKSDAGVLISNSAKLIESENLDRLGILFDKYVNYYTKNVLGIKNQFSRIHSWLTINSNNSYHKPHWHPNSMISVVLYFDEYLSDEPLSNLILHLNGLGNIFKNFNFVMNLEENNTFNYSQYFLYPKTNRLFIFPSNFPHESGPSPSQTKRFCIGANYFINDTISLSGLETIKISINNE